MISPSCSSLIQPAKAIALSFVTLIAEVCPSENASTIRNRPQFPPPNRLEIRAFCCPRVSGHYGTQVPPPLGALHVISFASR
jgi:hypothetical protein